MTQMLTLRAIHDRPFHKFVSEFILAEPVIEWRVKGR